MNLHRNFLMLSGVSCDKIQLRVSIDSDKKDKLSYSFQILQYVVPTPCRKIF